LGYSNTESFLAFWDLDGLGNGVEVFVEDADGTRYTYRAFEELVVNPTDTWIIEPVLGKNVLTLQTCTLSNYSQRLVIQAELVDETQEEAAKSRSHQDDLHNREV
jgi:sortase A